MLGSTSSTGTFAEHTVILSDSGTTNEGGLLLCNSPVVDGSHSSIKICASVSGGDSTADFVIGNVNNDAPNTILDIFLSGDGSTGNVGVATLSPLTTLHVDGSFSTGLVTIAATDSITAIEHAGRINLLGEVGGNALVTLTLPLATGTGNIYKFVVSVINTSNYIIKVVNAAHTMQGQIMITDNDTDVPNVFHTGASADTITLNGTTTGGGMIGDYIELIDIATNRWAVNGMVTCPAGSDDATMFSATVS